MQQANQCAGCGAGPHEALLGAFMRYRGGVGYVAMIECRDDRACWHRKGQKENGLAARNDEAA